MNEPSPRQENEAKVEARAAEAAAIRRRWITLGEVLAVIAVIISGLTLWNSWSDRSRSEAEKAVEARQTSARAATLVLITADSDKRDLALKPAAAGQTVQSQKITFPRALDAAPAETTGEPRIEATWFENPLKKARSEARLPDNSRGDERLPVLITTRFLVDGEPHEDIAIYDIGYSISGRFFGGHSLTLRGLSLISRVEGKGGQRRLDERWASLNGKP